MSELVFNKRDCDRIKAAIRGGVHHEDKIVIATKLSEDVVRMMLHKMEAVLRCLRIEHEGNIRTYYLNEAPSRVPFSQRQIKAPETLTGFGMRGATPFPRRHSR